VVAIALLNGLLQGEVMRARLVQLLAKQVAPLGG